MLSKSSADSGDEDPYIVASASSDGVIRVWDMRMVNKGKPNPLTEVNTKSRLTCLAGSSIRCECAFCLFFFLISRFEVEYVDLPCFLSAVPC